MKNENSDLVLEEVNDLVRELRQFLPEGPELADLADLL